MDRVTGRIWEEIEPDNPVQPANVLVKFANAEDVAAEDPCECGPYALASLFSFVLINVANAVI